MNDIRWMDLCNFFLSYFVLLLHSEQILSNTDVGGVSHDFTIDRNMWSSFCQTKWTKINVHMSFVILTLKPNISETTTTTTKEWKKCTELSKYSILCNIYFSILFKKSIGKYLYLISSSFFFIRSLISYHRFICILYNMKLFTCITFQHKFYKWT